MKFNEKLKDFRKQKGLTQKEFADEYGFSRTTITELESARKKPTLRMISKIAKATNTKTECWIEENDNNLSCNKFDGLELVLNKLIENGDIDAEGNMNDLAKELVMKMLEAEVKLFCKKNKN